MATTRAKLAIKNIGKYRTEEQALIEANYSPSYAKSGLIKRTKGWEELMEQHLPDRLLAKVHKEGLGAIKTQYKNNNESGEIERVGVEPDFATRHKYLDSAYKLKGSYAPEKKMNVNIDIPSEVREKSKTIINIFLNGADSRNN